MTHPQTSSFVPLVATMPSAEKREFQITVIPQTEQPPSFQSLEKTPASTYERSSSKKNCEPQLSVQREGDRVTSIRIQCNCGQTIDLACLYDPPAKARQNDPPVKAEQSEPPAKPKQSNSPAKVKQK